VSAFFVALVAISSCFKSTSLPITQVETVRPQDWDLGFGWVEFIVVSALAAFGYWKYIR